MIPLDLVVRLKEENTRLETAYPWALSPGVRCLISFIAKSKAATEELPWSCLGGALLSLGSCGSKNIKSAEV